MNLSSKSMEILTKHVLNNTIEIFKESGNKSSKVVLSNKSDDFILEARKVILEEQYDKISYRQLREFRGAETHEHFSKGKDKSEDGFIVHDSLKQTGNSNDCPTQIEIITKAKINGRSTFEQLKGIYFHKWKQYTFNECHKLENNFLVEKKLDFLLEAMNKKRQNNESAKNYGTKRMSIASEKEAKSPSIYINRYNAQKNIIQQQKEKLVEQERLIDELKFNKIKQDIDKSVEQSKYEIHSIFKKCSRKGKRKTSKTTENSSETANSLDDSCDEYLKLDFAKVPKFVKELEARAKERELNRQIIRERKRIIDENRKKMAEELLEKKRLMDEDETKRNLEIMKEKRRQEMEKDKLRKKYMKMYLTNCEIADTFYEKRTVKIYFEYWIRLISLKEFNETKAACHYERRLLKKCYDSLMENSKNMIAVKNQMADNLYTFKLKKYYLFEFQFLLREKRRNLQVAQDFYDMNLEQRIFVQWHRNVCRIQMDEIKQLKKADTHYLKKIKFHYFYQWRTLSAVLLLEKAKEEKRMKWRRKVLEVLPDYKPPIDN